MIGNPYHWHKHCSWTCRPPRSYGLLRGRTRAADRRLPGGRTRCSVRPVGPRRPVRVLRSRPLRGARLLQSTSSGTGSSPATRTSRTSSRIRRRSRPRTPRRRIGERPVEIQAILDDAGFNYASGLSARQPPDHTRLRRFIQKAFTPRRVAALEPEVRSLTVGLIERMQLGRQGRPRRRPRESPPGARHLPTARRTRHRRGAGKAVGAESGLSQLRRPAGRRAGRARAQPRGVRPLLRRSRRRELRAARGRPPWRPGPHLPRRRRLPDQGRDRRTGLHAAVRRSRDDDIAARMRPEGVARTAGSLGGALRRSDADPGGGGGDAAPRTRRVHLEAHHDLERRGSATPISRQARTCCFCSGRPIATRASLPNRIASTSSARTPAATSRSATESTSASERHSRASRCRSCSRSSRSGFPACAWSTVRPSSTGATPRSADR